jgi:hypothetical protein
MPRTVETPTEAKPQPIQRLRLLDAYAQALNVGLTDEQAAAVAGLKDSCYWKRCGELRKAGLIAPTGDKRRNPESGVRRIVCAITESGMDLIDDE